MPLGTCQFPAETEPSRRDPPGFSLGLIAQSSRKATANRHAYLRECRKSTEVLQTLDEIGTLSLGESLGKSPDVSGRGRRPCQVRILSGTQSPHNVLLYLGTALSKSRGMATGRSRGRSLDPGPWLYLVLPGGGIYPCLSCLSLSSLPCRPILGGLCRTRRARGFPMPAKHLLCHATPLHVASRGN